MSGKVVSLIALVPMLFHSIFGCCWHHVHMLPGDAQVTAAVADEALVRTHSTRSCCGHAHGSSQQVPAEVALVGQAAGEPQPSEHPPCEEEDCAVDLGVVIANHSEKISFEAWDFFPSDLHELRLIDQLQESVWCGVIERSLPDSARERCAITQTWRI
ncbi:hypothetical protein Spb1_14540 [Planctopirus ephydatiae]|uniref:Uncharacterized protein n=1 Tax=Planctopirus ephydatiae TaxID=2528019 RepID=A0A518GLX1_9PLAN|nr:hypothetical protein [Planctopirus ephydatiae]QDV29546.1 hypothetical protein Spb1_14540 [Planctopirus ephydatiae]